MIARLCLAIWLLAVLTNAHALDEKSLNEAIALRELGEFEKASRALQVILEQTTPTIEQDDRRVVEFEIERIRRIRLDYKLTREKLLQQLRRKITSCSEEEFERFEREGLFDVQLIDGQKRYVNSSASNLLLRVPALRERLKSRNPDTMYRRLYNEMLHVRASQALTSSSLLLPRDIGVTYTLVVEHNAVAEGKLIRCWMPFARAFPYHSDIYLYATSPTRYNIASPEAPHRTVYLQAQAVKDQPTTFSISFVYRSWSRANDVDPSAVEPYRKDAPDYGYYTAEHKPHINFSNEELKKLSTEIVAGESNPYLAARRIYDWIGANTIYQFAREYSTLDNIALYTATRRAGDCGQHGMLFIALCRMNGIPARWTTGWECFNKNGNNMHDWCEFYVEPFGWLPADPDMAVNILKHVDGELNTTQCKELADWLFGNMDSLRLTVNSDFGAPLFPVKQDFRSETVDFQRGEVESDGMNLYFDKWDYSMQMQPLPLSAANDIASRYIPPAPEGYLDVSGTYLQSMATTAALEGETAIDNVAGSPASSGTAHLRTGPVSAAGIESSSTQASSDISSATDVSPALMTSDATSSVTAEGDTIRASSVVTSQSLPLDSNTTSSAH
ncbi:MAG: transglutaminase-like domain-containing protein [Candidatus Sumerlaeaceae bacterium]